MTARLRYRLSGTCLGEQPSFTTLSAQRQITALSSELGADLHNLPDVQEALYRDLIDQLSWRLSSETAACVKDARAIPVTKTARAHED